ncbi:hypothetical protein CK203_085802 [Vitis vinifera]|uniref:Uncharacterized protein n=1 Tax=Vitis vinifera TaxID=29760 RepID=A0A438DIQ3_VITVI|nr:hypothetical protein CK203_085802 [Vitis vinifera]
MTTRGVPRYQPRYFLPLMDARVFWGLNRLRGFPYPYAPADPTAFRRWAPLSEWDMVRSLSRGTSSQRTIFRRELPPGMLLVDVSFSLEQWNQLWLHQHSPELPEPREVPPAPSTSAPSEPVPEAASSDAPPAVPPTVEPPITIPGSEYRALLASFQTLTTTQTAIMERIGPLPDSAGPADSHSS